MGKALLGIFEIYRKSYELKQERRMEKFDRITIDPKLFGGKPCIRGLRFPVSKILDLLVAVMLKRKSFLITPILKKKILFRQ